MLTSITKFAPRLELNIWIIILFPGEQHAEGPSMMVIASWIFLNEEQWICSNGYRSPNEQVKKAPELWVIILCGGWETIYQFRYVGLTALESSSSSVINKCLPGTPEAIIWITTFGCLMLYWAGCDWTLWRGFKWQSDIITFHHSHRSQFKLVHS